MDQHFGRPLNEAKALFILLRWKLGYDNPFICLHIFVTLHCERFSGPGLAVCENSRVVAFNHSFNHPRYPRLLKGLSLGAALPQHFVESISTALLGLVAGMNPKLVLELLLFITQPRLKSCL